MTKILLEIKTHVNTVLSEVGIDTLLNSKWAKLEEMVQLLEPFAIQTDVMQTDFMSLSLILPSLLDIECHLQQFIAAEDVACRMLSDMRNRFSNLLNPDSYQFNPLPAVACLLDPNVATVILTIDMQHLFSAAKLYIISQVRQLS